MQTLLIIDGSSLLFQSFFGMPNKIKNQQGEYVEAVVCFIGILLKTIKMTSPSQLLIVFDGENPLERQTIDENYKANRQDFSLIQDEENPFSQLAIIQDLLTKLNISWLETTNCEADDLIASIVNDNKSKLKIIISSPDKDFFQLIDKTTNVFTYRGKVSTLWTNELIKNKYGFDAQYFSTLRSLMGDHSDNIKGIQGIGIKTAAKLIQEFGNLDKIYLNLEKINCKLRDLLINNKEVASKNYKLINLKDKTGLFNLCDCSFSLHNLTSTEILKKYNILP